MSAPTRPVLRWHGGKWKLAPWILQHLPPHRIYVEPYGGAASVLLRKPRSYAEVYNDLDEEVVNLFRVLREPVHAARLIELLRLTPFARAEWKLSFEETGDQVERARRLIVRASFSGGTRGILDLDAVNAGFNGGTARCRADNPNRTHAWDWQSYPAPLVAVVTRLDGVIIEQRLALEILAANDGAETLFYVDPPYLPVTRGERSGRCYHHELTAYDHAALLAFLQALAGMVVLSGYPSALYDDALTGWRRVTTKAHADGARERTEVLWINPAAAEALDRVRRGDSTPLFAEAACV